MARKKKVEEIIKDDADIADWVDDSETIAEDVEASVPESAAPEPHPWEGHNVWGSYHGGKEAWWLVQDGKLILTNCHQLHPTKKRFYAPHNIIPDDMERA